MHFINNIMFSWKTLFSFRIIENTFPFLVIVPFTYLIWHPRHWDPKHKTAYDRVRTKIIIDAKTGKIRQAFIMGWLKNITLKKVILGNEDIRIRAIDSLKRGFKNPVVSVAFNQTMVQIINRPEVAVELNRFFSDSLKRADLLSDEDLKNITESFLHEFEKFLRS